MRWRSGGSAAVPGSADGGAPANRAFARLRRSGCWIGGHSQVLPLGLGRSRESDHLSHGAPSSWRSLLGYLTFTGSLMAAGKLQEVKWIPQRPVTYPGQNLTNLGLLGVAVVVGVGAGRSIPTASWAPGLFPVVIVLCPGLRSAADHPDRRRRHADRDRDPELVRRTVGRGHGLRARQQAADHGGRAGRLERSDPGHHHVQGDEPLVHSTCSSAPSARPSRPRRAATARCTRRRRSRVAPRCWSRPAWW